MILKVFPTLLTLWIYDYGNAAPWSDTVCLLFLTCFHSSLPVFRENPSCCSCCVRLQVIFSRPLSFLQSSCSLQIFISMLSHVEYSREKPMCFTPSLSHSSGSWGFSAPVVSVLFCKLLVSWIYWIWNMWHCEWQVLSSTSCIQAENCIHETLLFYWNRCLYEKKKKKPWTHHLFYNTVKSSNWQESTLKSLIHPNTQHCWSSIVWCLPAEAGYCTHQSCLFGTHLGVNSHFFFK